MVASGKFVELAQFQIDPESVALLPKDFCEKWSCVILSTVHRNNLAQPVTIGMLDPEDPKLIGEITKRLGGRRVNPVQLNAFEIRQALARGYGTAVEDDRSKPLVTLSALRRISFVPDQSPAAIVDDMLSEAVRLRANDVHIEIYKDDIDLRFRVDGVLRQVTTPLSPENVKKVVSRIKVLCSLDIAEKKQPQDGRFAAIYEDEHGGTRPVNFRVATLPGPHGEDCVLRVLDAGKGRLTLEQLGLSPTTYHVLKTLLRCPSGLVLVSGPTGSGKTTTLYAALLEIGGPDVKCLTVEDPIEYEVTKVNQRGVTDDIGFAAYARAFLRQDPDTIMIGEIRDEETASVALRAANTGHLVLSTIHTQDAVAAVSRLRALGIDDELTSTVLLGVVSQRLVRKVCPQCRVQYAPSAETIVRFYQDDPGHSFVKGAGCEACGGTGYRGQLGLFEVFVLDDAIQASIASHATLDEIRRRAKERGFVPLVEEALERVRAGVTSLEEVERTVRPLYLV